MQSLSRLPGVNSIEIGAGQSKPMIRGLSFNQVAVVEQGLKHQGQEWGIEHGLEVDQYAVERAEIVKGPSSLKYGSDAIGGIIDLVHYKKPLKQTYGGDVSLSYKSNNHSMGGSLSAFVRPNNWYYLLRATWVEYGDFRVPTDTVDIRGFQVDLDNNRMRNTAGHEWNMNTTIGFEDDKIDNRLIVSLVNARTGFFASAHGIEPRQVDTALHDRSNRDILQPFHTIQHLKVQDRLIWKGPVNWSVDVGYQRNFRQEWSQYVSHGYMPPNFPENMPFPEDLEREFLKHTGGMNLMAYSNENKRLYWEGGVNAEMQGNSISGRGFIIPAFQQIQWGIFGMVRYKIRENQTIQGGLRYDWGWIQTEEYRDWYASPVETPTGDTVWINLSRTNSSYGNDLERRFSSISGSIGYTLEWEQWLIKVNLGKGFRMPIAKELAANGVNYHRFSFEVGDPNLRPEQSYQLDLSLEYTNPRFALGLNPYFNYFSNYIYLNPTPEFDRLYGEGNQIFEYSEAEVFRFGAELHAHYDLFKFLELGVIADFVYAEQLSGEKKGFGLPFTPPARGLFNVKWKPKSTKKLRNSYLSIDWAFAATQNRIVPPEDPTPAYQLIHFSAGTDLMIGKVPVGLQLQVRNVLNTYYFNHTSIYRIINAPEPGRNIMLSAYIPVSGHLKHKH
jgi:iron complex outermembrane receptor protein